MQCGLHMPSYIRGDISVISLIETINYHKCVYNFNDCYLSCANCYKQGNLIQERVMLMFTVQMYLVIMLCILTTSAY